VREVTPHIGMPYEDGGEIGVDGLLVNGGPPVGALPCFTSLM